ncbi:hypothetical protein DL93DRAFT_1678421 [Clavulina sp. PMI_390]|nr:hypothetical protein DL93DRAFT_1678421 [Clavulina sp. PMI_390]
MIVDTSVQIIGPSDQPPPYEDLEPYPPTPSNPPRPLPAGWMTCTDEISGQLFYVDAIRLPPHSIWTHPLDDPEYIKAARRSFNFDKFATEEGRATAQAWHDASYLQRREREYAEWTAAAASDLEAKLQHMRTCPYTPPPARAWGGPKHHETGLKSAANRIDAVVDGFSNLLFGTSWQGKYTIRRDSH